MKNIQFYNLAFSISIFTIAFITYYFVSHLKVIANFLTKKAGEETGQTRFVLAQRLIGILCLGIFPAFLVIFKNNDFTISWLAVHFNFSSLIWTVAIGSVFFIINWFASRSSDNLDVYPQIRAKKWSIQLLLVSSLSWIAYLFAYEFIFRGFLLFSCVNEIGTFTAITLNVSLYALAHLPKGAKETIGAIPMGIILCLLTIHFGTIWSAFCIHCCLALSNEWFSIKYHKGIKIV